MARQNYNKEMVAWLLKEIQSCVSQDKFIISQNDNRQENIEFIQEYNFTHQKQKDLLLSIEIDDFCYTMPNRNKNFPADILYLFCPQRTLNTALGEEEVVDIYIKCDPLIYDDNKHIIVISFHKRKEPLTYAFR